jgi:diguanylate cyclase (GGDEF)-like protein/PAS domain S-box-containing protein
MLLINFIAAHTEQILQEWEDYAQTMNIAKKMDRQVLRDHVHQMLEWIAKDVISPQNAEEQMRKSRGSNDFLGPYSNNIASAANAHGLRRFDSGFSIEEVVSEYRALRASILRLWKQASGTAKQTEIEDLIRFNEAIDQGLAESVASYGSEKERQVRLFETILSTSPDHNCIFDLDGRFTYVNQSLAAQFKLSIHQLIGKNLFDVGYAKAAEFHQQILQVIHTKQPFHTDTLYEREPGKHRYFEYILTPVITPDGHVEAVAGTARDITARKASDEDTWHKANYDLLTGLPNRRLFRDRLEQEVKHSERSDIPVALFFIDLDRFKEANDMLGHDAGDLLLRQAAERIRFCIRDKDTVARLGGDEFTVILTDINAADHIEIIANKILKELANPFFVVQEMVHISASIGITLFPKDALTPEHLVRNADRAMYNAKNAGRNRFRFYTDDMHEAAEARYRLIADLRLALLQRQFILYYQPIVNLTNGQIHKAEALLRWIHPELGLVLPGKFIPLAEETGLINEIGEWVFAEAARQSKEWALFLERPLQISVNKSPVEFMGQPEGMNWGAHLQQLGLASNSILIEITEGVLLSAVGEVASKLASLHEAGIQLAVDDFGTGYSSMSYLNKFDVDYLKIDQSFVHGMATDVNSRTIAETIIVMAHKLGLKVIAEGVETVDQRNWLKASGCDYAQGFLFAEALPAQEFFKFLESGPAMHFTTTETES